MKTLLKGLGMLPHDRGDDQRTERFYARFSDVDLSIRRSQLENEHHTIIRSCPELADEFIRRSHPWAKTLRKIERLLTIIDSVLTKRAQGVQVNLQNHSQGAPAPSVEDPSASEDTSKRASADPVVEHAPGTPKQEPGAKGWGRAGRPRGTLADGAKVRALRGECTQEEWADKCGISLRTVQRGECGGPLNDKTFEAFAEVLSALKEKTITPEELKLLLKTHQE